MYTFTHVLLYMYMYILTCIHLSSGMIKFPDRMESISGETYFGSEQLFNTQIDDVRPFIANFTLPETGGNSTGINGTLDEVKQQMMQYHRQNRTVTSLVLYFTSSNLVYTTTSRAHIHVNLERIDAALIRELWIFLPAENVHEYYSGVDLSIPPNTFASLRSLHIVNTQLPGDFVTVLPYDFRTLCRQLSLFHSNHNSLYIFKRNNSAGRVGLDDSFLMDALSTDVFGDIQVLAISNSFIPNNKPTTNRTNLAPTSNPRLQYLQLQSSFLEYVPKHIHIRFPGLMVLDVSHNLENLAQDHIFRIVQLQYETLLFHPSVRLFVSVNNIDTQETAERQILKQTQPNIGIGLVEDQLVEQDRQCISKLFDNSLIGRDREQQCRYLKCLFGLEHLPCDYDYISYDNSCTFGTRLPISRNLQEVYLSNVLYPEYGVGMLWSRTWNRLRYLSTREVSLSQLITCYQPNKLKKIDVRFETMLVSTLVMDEYNSLQFYNHSKILGLSSSTTFSR